MQFHNIKKLIFNLYKAMRIRQDLEKRFFDVTDSSIKFKEGIGLTDLVEYIEGVLEEKDNQTRKNVSKAVEYVINTLFERDLEIIRWNTPTNEKDFTLITYRDCDAPRFEHEHFRYATESGTWSYLLRLREKYVKKPRNKNKTI